MKKIHYNLTVSMQMKKWQKYRSFQFKGKSISEGGFYGWLKNRDKDYFGYKLQRLPNPSSNNLEVLFPPHV